MVNLSRDDLWSLEEYAVERANFRARVIEHKKTRQVALSDHARLYFEDALTIKYQIQEMLRIEKVFEADGIMEELEAYNPLIPDGTNWKATFMLEYEDPQERGLRLAELIGVEDKVWIQIEGCDKVWPIADEDLDRETADKTSSVHFMRYELDNSMITAARNGAAITMGIDHPGMPVEGILVEDAVRESLVKDLQEVSIN